MAQRILVTGGAGFIGSTLVRRLLSRGDEVVVVDNFFTGRRENLAALRGQTLTVVDHDINEVFDPGPVDAIFNLACPASPPHYQRDPIYTSRTNFNGALNTLELARKYGARILHASTSEVYGDPERHPQREDYRGSVNCTGPRACYDEGKRLAESLCFDYLRHHHTDVRVVRIFNTYGPWMDPDDGRVVSNFICQALLGQDLTIYGDGQQTRSFCYVDDLVGGFLAMMDQTQTHGPVNLGNPGEFTMMELAQKVIHLVGGTSQLVYRPLPVDDPTRRRPDITLARERLGWSPTVSLDEGLPPTIAYFRERLITST